MRSELGNVVIAVAGNVATIGLAGWYSIAGIFCASCTGVWMLTQAYTRIFPRPRACDSCPLLIQRQEKGTK